MNMMVIFSVCSVMEWQVLGGFVLLYTSLKGVHQVKLDDLGKL